jgi:hypothetical protein
MRHSLGYCGVCAVKDATLRVVPAYYDLATGKVELLG